MTTPGPESNNDKAPIEIFLGEIILVFFGDSGYGLVGFLRLLESPLLLVGEKFDEDEEDEESREDHVGEVECEGFRQGGHQEEDVRWGRDHE